MALLNQTQQEYYNSHDFGNYQFTSLNDIINQFMVAYVGKDKIISKISRGDVAFHAQRAMQELSFDTFKSCKSQEMTIPASLQMILPQDYVNYTKISWVDSAGIKHLLYPASKTSNPTRYQVDSNDEFIFDMSNPNAGKTVETAEQHNTYEGGNRILSGNLIENGNFQGGTKGWRLNINNVKNGTVHNYAIGGGSSANLTITSLATHTLGDPVRGYFYGWNGNAIGAYDVPEKWGIVHNNVPIISGEEYKITYTLSGYTSGSWQWFIIDKDGDSSKTTEVTANGTYEETITAGTTSHNFSPSCIFFRNSSTTNGNVVIDSVSIVRVGDENSSTTLNNYKSTTPSENNSNDYEDDVYWPAEGSRFGLDPQYAQTNGSFYIDCVSGKIHFSSNINGKTVILDYISDSLGTDGEMQVHKFAEEAMYKWISHAVLASRANTPEYLVARYKRERFAAIRTAKLRLSNIKLEEITQILRGKSKQIKH